MVFPKNRRIPDITGYLASSQQLAKYHSAKQLDGYSPLSHHYLQWMLNQNPSYMLPQKHEEQHAQNFVECHQSHTHTLGSVVWECLVHTLCFKIVFTNDTPLIKWPGLAYALWSMRCVSLTVCVAYITSGVPLRKCTPPVSSLPVLPSGAYQTPR